jgi:hypothetical protein
MLNFLKSVTNGHTGTVSNFFTLQVCVFDSLYCVVEICKNKTRKRKIIGAITHRSPITAFLLHACASYSTAQVP